MKSIDELHAARTRLGLSQRTVAEAMGTTQSALSRAERDGNPTQAFLLRYDKALEALHPTDSVLEIVTLKMLVAGVVAKYHIAELYVFGSVARGDAQADSDVDLLYRFEPGVRRSMTMMQDLTDALESLLGRTVSLTSYDALERDAERSRAGRRFLDHILPDLVRVA